MYIRLFTNIYVYNIAVYGQLHFEWSKGRPFATLPRSRAEAPPLQGFGDLSFGDDGARTTT